MATENRRQFQRRRTAAQWASENPVLAAGEVGVSTGETFIGFKIGDGTTAWNSLPGVAVPARFRAVDTNYTTPGLTTDPLLSVADGRTITVDGASYYKGIVMAGTIVETGPLFSGGRSFEESSVITNTPGVAKTTPHHTGFYAAAIIRGDGALHTTARSAFLDPGAYDIVNTGTVTAATHTSFDSTMAVGSGVTATIRRAFQAQDASGAGTVTTQVGVDILALAKATTNIGLRNASTEVATPSVATITAAGNTIAANAKVKRLDNTSGGAITLTSTPTIADGQDGQILILFNSSANNVVLTHGAANNLRLDGGTNKTLAQRASITLMFSSTIGDWIQISPVVTPT